MARPDFQALAPLPAARMLTRLGTLQSSKEKAQP